MNPTADIVEIVIGDIAFGGDGVGRYDGVAVFVPFTVRGERVAARVIEKRPRFCRAEVATLLTRSPDRVEPKCPLFGRCGGCCYQHIDYPAQVAVKSHQLGEVMRRLAKLDDLSVVQAVVPAPSGYGYRNKITLHGGVPGGGFIARDGRTVLAVAECPIAAPAINACLADPGRKDAVHGHMSVRANARGKTWVYDATIRQQATIEDWVGPVAFRVPLDGFFQVNHAVAEKLAHWLREAVSASGCEHLVDAYCGAGVLGLLSVADGMTLLGIERERAAARAAEHNAARLGVARACFEAGTTAARLPALLGRLPPERTCLLLDPPRAGCEKDVIETIRARRPAELIYVSCNPPVMARDLTRLLDLYGVACVAGFDMFPQTAQFEAAAVLRLR